MPRLRTPADVGSLIRATRLEQHLTLEQLAGRADVSRRWLIQVEHGHPRAELAHVLRTVAALGLVLTGLDPSSAPQPVSTQERSSPPIDLDRHLRGFAD